MNNMKMRRLSTLCLMLLFLAISIAIPSAGPARVLRISYNPLPFNLPSMILRREGYLEKALLHLGWQVEWLSNLQTGPLMSEAMAAGALDLAPVMGDTSAVIARVAGNDLAVLWPYSLAPKAFAIVAPAGGHVRQVPDLAGRKIGLPIGTAAHYLLVKALTREHLKPAQVDLINMSVPEAAVAVASGKLDAAVLVEPMLSKILAGGAVVLVRDGSDLIGGMTVAAVRGTFYRQNPDIIKAYQKALQKAGGYMMEKPDAAMRIAAEETKLPAELLKSIAAKYRFVSISRTTMLHELTVVINFLADQGLIARRPRLLDMVR